MNHWFDKLKYIYDSVSWNYSLSFVVSSKKNWVEKEYISEVWSNFKKTNVNDVGLHDFNELIIIRIVIVWIIDNQSVDQWRINILT